MDFWLLLGNDEEGKVFGGMICFERCNCKAHGLELE